MEWDPLVADLRRLRGKYDEMRAAAARQMEILTTPDLAGLDEVVERKRAVMAEIDALNEGTRALREEWRRRRDGESAEARAAVDAAADEVNAALAELLKLEEQGSKAMEARQKGAGEQLKEVRRTKDARKSYGGGPAPGESRFFDSGA